MFATLLARLHIHLPKWLTAFLGSAAITFVQAFYDQVTNSGLSLAALLSILTWKTAIKVALGAVILKVLGQIVRWVMNKLAAPDPAPTNPAPTPPA